MQVNCPTINGVNKLIDGYILLTDRGGRVISKMAIPLMHNYYCSILL